MYSLDSSIRSFYGSCAQSANATTECSQMVSFFLLPLSISFDYTLGEWDNLKILTTVYHRLLYSLSLDSIQWLIIIGWSLFLADSSSGLLIILGYDIYEDG